MDEQVVDDDGGVHGAERIKNSMEAAQQELTQSMCNDGKVLPMVDFETPQTERLLAHSKKAGVAVAVAKAGAHSGFGAPTPT